MSYDYSAVNHKHVKINYLNYLHSASEPEEKESHLPRMERNTELIEDSYVIRYRFRQLARQLRES